MHACLRMGYAVGVPYVVNMLGEPTRTAWHTLVFADMMKEKNANDALAVLSYRVCIESVCCLFDQCAATQYVEWLCCCL